MGTLKGILTERFFRSFEFPSRKGKSIGRSPPPHHVPLGREVAGLLKLKMQSPCVMVESPFIWMFPQSSAQVPLMCFTASYQVNEPLESVSWTCGTTPASVNAGPIRLEDATLRQRQIRQLKLDKLNFHSRSYLAAPTLSAYLKEMEEPGEEFRVQLVANQLIEGGDAPSLGWPPPHFESLHDERHSTSVHCSSETFPNILLIGGSWQQDSPRYPLSVSNDALATAGRAEPNPGHGADRADNSVISHQLL
ncbi:MAG: hypothetical protein MMC33_002830 [Icmadophila ericetorum]|nr:hypothetical protein [Icmadophila ericetorum]